MAGKKAFGFVRDCVEKYIPSIALAALFIIFCYQVFMRYVLRQPQAWAGEVEQSCFLWLVLLGACYAQRMKAHVTFTLLYDKLSIKGTCLVTSSLRSRHSATFCPRSITFWVWRRAIR